MAVQKYLIGSTVLNGESRIPGVEIPDDLKKVLPDVFKAVTNYGCDYYPTVVQMLSYDEMSEVAAYGGFPVRYPHWQWGMEYEELQHGYVNGMHRIYEMVVNCLCPKTKVLSFRGTINAEDVKEGDILFNGKPRSVAKVVRQEKSKTIKIKVKGYAHDLVSTPNHKWLVVPKNGSPYWKQASEIKSGDMLIGQDSWEVFMGMPAKFEKIESHKKFLETKNNEVFDWYGGSFKSYLSSEMTMQLAELMGLLARSETNIDNGQIHVHTSNKNTDYINYVRSVFMKIFGCCDISDGNKDGYCRIGITSFYVASFLSSIGFSVDCVPSSILMSSNEYRSSFMQGFFKSGFPSYLENMEIIGNREIFSQMQLMLMEIGIKTNINKNLFSFATNQDVDKFESRILSHKFLDGKNVPVSYEVESTEEYEEMETIDIALWDAEHDFTANGFVTHNTNPCYIYCMDSNTLIDNVTVVAHALGHNDFFKNNIFFSATSKNMLNQMANNAGRIRRYMRRWGEEAVGEFIDHVIRISTLIDPANAWKQKTIKDINIKDKRVYFNPKRIQNSTGHDYMETYINPDKWLDKQKDIAMVRELSHELNLFENPTRDIMGFLKDNAPLKTWQSDILSMLYEESLYFAPQRLTKMINEGWASLIDYKIMCEGGLCGLGQETHDSGIIEYAKHKMGVLGGKYSQNPYKVGYMLFNDIIERWDKGRFGEEYESCKNAAEKENWNKNLNLGKEKSFEVRKYYNDLLMINEFFTKDFCDKNEFYEWKQNPDGSVECVSKDFKSIKRKLMQKHTNGGLPEIKLTDPNFKGKGFMLLEHSHDGRPLYPKYLRYVLSSMCEIWKNPVFLTTKTQDGDEMVYCAASGDQEEVKVFTREEFDSNYKNI